MRGRIRTHLTYANVMATLAVFIALGGVAYAAATITGSDVVNGSLTTLDYKNNDIRSGDIRNDTATGGGLSTADLAPGSVGASEVFDGSLGTADTDPLVSADNSFSVVPFDLSASAAGGSTDAQPWGSTSLLLTANCHPSGSPGVVDVNFVNRSDSAATLNWLYGDGTGVSASGVALQPSGTAGSLKEFSYSGKRIEGQFIYSGANSKITLNLHAVDLGSRCELHGTAMRAAE